MDKVFEKLRANTRFWSDPEYRANVLEWGRIKMESRRIVARLVELHAEEDALCAQLLRLNRGPRVRNVTPPTDELPY